MHNQTLYNLVLYYLATLGPIGRKLPAPGTAGSLVALIAGYCLLSLGWWVLATATILCCIIGVFAADIYSVKTGTHDAGAIIIDEVAGQWIVLLFIPIGFWSCLLAFVLFRLYDITKCWPVNKAEALSGGIGVMADDIVAGIMAGISALIIIYLAGNL